MPEPYTFPPLPDRPFDPDPRMGTVHLEYDGVHLFMTPPCKESNFISFVFHGNREIARFAMTVDDANNPVWIGEDGLVKSRDEVIVLLFRIVLGSEKFERCKEAMPAWRNLQQTQGV